MSTTTWTDPITKQPYKIGTIGWELPKPKGLWDFCLNTVKGTYLGMIKDILVPTYGFWGGPGWSGNDRPINSKDIKWEQVPCYKRKGVKSLLGSCWGMIKVHADVCENSLRITTVPMLIK